MTGMRIGGGVGSGRLSVNRLAEARIEAVAPARSGAPRRAQGAADVARRTRRRRSLPVTYRAGKVSLRWVLLIAVFLFTAIPLYWIAVTSFTPNADIQGTWPPRVFPAHPTFENYRTAFRQLPMARFMLNSLIIAVFSIATNVIFCSMAGYAFARRSFPGSGKLFILIASSIVVPSCVRVIPNYLITQQLHMINSYEGIVLPTAVTGFGIFLMRQYFISIPKELEDSARVDGCTEWGVFFRVIVPIARPAVASLALFSFVASVQDFLWPLIVTNSTNMRPLPVGITEFISTNIDWGGLTAATTLTILPIALMYLLLQRHFIRGLTAGALKG